MAKKTNIWVYVIIALIVGVLIGYAVAGGFAAGGKATVVKFKCVCKEDSITCNSDCETCCVPWGGTGPTPTSTPSS